MSDLVKEGTKNESNSYKETQLLREDLVNTAVKFLLTPKIQNSPNNVKRKFLLSKGLTDIEVDIAFERSGLQLNQFQDSQFNRHVALRLQPNSQVWQPPPRSTWQWIRDLANTVTALGGLFYAIYWLWKNYIYPYFFGKPKKKSIESSIAELESKVETCVMSLKTGMQTIHSAVDSLTEQKTAEVANGILVTRIQEVKSEITSLKALLLNRNQFPAIPVPLGRPSIPSWQLHENLKETEGNKELEEEGTGSECTTNNGSDSSSLEMIKEQEGLDYKH